MDLSAKRPASDQIQRFLIDGRKDHMGIWLDGRIFLMKPIPQKQHLIARLCFLVLEKRNEQHQPHKERQAHRENGGDRRIGKGFHASADWPRLANQRGSGKRHGERELSIWVSPL